MPRRIVRRIVVLDIAEDISPEELQRQFGDVYDAVVRADVEVKGVVKFGVASDRFGVEDWTFGSHEDALAKRDELRSLAAYRREPLYVVEVYGTAYRKIDVV